MVNVAFEPDKRDADWLIFDGSASPSGDDFHLRPSDMRVSIHVDKADVFLPQEGGKTHVFVRRGSQYKAIVPDPGFDFNSIEIIQSRVSSSCPKGSRCFGGVEYCCGSNVAVNNCYGRWRCPGHDTGQ
jgi:hypothetical protein